jgi:Protein of unknown function (DUF1260).
MAESFIEEELAIQAARNARLIETIEQHGGDLTVTRPIDFFFFTTMEADARSLAEDLEDAGFDRTHVSVEEIEGKWSVQGVRMDSILGVTSESFVEQIVRLCVKYLAEFDGWGTAI